MSRPMLLALVFVLGCGGPSSPGAVTPETAPVTLTRERADLVCTEELPSGEAACVARGCEWRAPLRCSGIEEPELLAEERYREVPRICRCVCQRDVMECMARP